MTSRSYSRALGLLAAWLLCCYCCGVAHAAFTSPYILRRVPAMMAAPAPRLEIRDLMANRYQATLFIRSLLALQERNITRLDSFARIAAIHGSPTMFDGVANGREESRGYCKHSSLLFGPWHRPYLMMMEQAIFEQANLLAAQYNTSDKAQYVTAARGLRLPYWDWGLAGGQVPAVIFQPTHEVTLPNGTMSHVRNPLKGYCIPTNAASQFNIPESFLNIFRSWTGPPAALSNIASLRSGLVSMFKTSTFNCFTNETLAGCTNTGSLEALHNLMHRTIGGSGHMSYIRYAAFDPVFWLHHCNVDRQLAIWEGIHPEARMDTIADQHTFPFRKTCTTWWTARDVMNVYDASGQGTRRFGYYYPELADPAVTPAQLLAMVDKLYNSLGRRARTIITLPSVSTSPVDGTATILLMANASTATAPTADTTGSRRPRRIAVFAGSITVFKAGSAASRFPASYHNLDVTRALDRVKAANPGVTSIDIVATITPFDSDTAASLPAQQVVNLGMPIVSIAVDGQIVAPTDSKRPVTCDSVKLFQGVRDIQAVVQGSVQLPEMALTAAAQRRRLRAS